MKRKKLQRFVLQKKRKRSCAKCWANTAKVSVYYSQIVLPHGFFLQPVSEYGKFKWLWITCPNTWRSFLINRILTQHQQRLDNLQVHFLPTLCQLTSLTSSAIMSWLYHWFAYSRHWLIFHSSRWYFGSRKASYCAWQGSSANISLQRDGHHQQFWCFRQLCTLRLKELRCLCSYFSQRLWDQYLPWYLDNSIPNMISSQHRILLAWVTTSRSWHWSHAPFQFLFSLLPDANIRRSRLSNWSQRGPLLLVIPPKSSTLLTKKEQGVIQSSRKSWLFTSTFWTSTWRLRTLETFIVMQ